MIRFVRDADAWDALRSLPSSIPNPDLKIGTNVILCGDIISVVNS
jgi:hypothetical protein